MTYTLLLAFRWARKKDKAKKKKKPDSWILLLFASDVSPLLQRSLKWKGGPGSAELPPPCPV